MQRILLILTLTCLLLGSLIGLVSAESSAECQQPNPMNLPLLSVYVLAFDNNPAATNVANLSDKAAATLQGLTNATAVKSDRVAVILLDGDQADDTQLLVAFNGTLTSINCLPDQAGNLDASLKEFDTTDGKTLGGFLLWAQQTYPADRTIFSYIGHGSFFAPATDVPVSQLIEEPGNPRALSPLPDKVDANPAYTDHHLPDEEGQSLITPYDLASAFNIAIEAGHDRMVMIDLVHCFGGSIEEFYELRDYATYLVGSPNYAFFDPSMPGAILAAFSIGQPDIDFPALTLTTYEAIIPPTDHPHVTLAVEGSRLDDVKAKWDALSEALLNEFDADPIATADRLETAYLASSQYDTTFCEDPSELLLAPPDALSDMGEFAVEIGRKFNKTSLIANLANDVTIAIAATLPLAQNVQHDSPWFYAGTGATPFWQFNEEPFYSVFTPFNVWTSASGDNYHTWQSLWYSSTLEYGINGVKIENFYPYQFVQSNGSRSWADVVARYWQVRGMVPGIDVDTAFCAPPLVGLNPGSVEMGLKVEDDRDPVQTGELTTYTIDIYNYDKISITKLAIIHTLAPTMQLHSAPTNCELTDRTLICPRADLLPQKIDSYQVSVQMFEAGEIPFNSEVSKLQTGDDPAVTEWTQVESAPLAVKLREVSVGGHEAWLTLTLVGLLTLSIVGWRIWSIKMQRRIET